jgi:hypothetical protein
VNAAIAADHDDVPRAGRHLDSNLFFHIANCGAGEHLQPYASGIEHVSYERQSLARTAAAGGWVDKERNWLVSHLPAAECRCPMLQCPRLCRQNGLAHA